MRVPGPYERCRIYIEKKSKESQEYSGLRQKPEVCPFITISRQTGTGAGSVSKHLIEYLQKFSDSENCSWTFFDKMLIEKILEDHNLPAEISNYMKEDKYRHISTTVQEMLGLHPGEWTLLHKTTETIFQLARMGNVIIVGRAASIITSKLKTGFNVRLVAPLQHRISRITGRYGLTEKQAADFIKKEDAARKNYVKSYFYKNIDDALLYDLVINMERLSYKHAARMIGDCVVEKFKERFDEKMISMGVN